ncbi:MAG: hypothetical protein K2X91_17115, partial [Thermoleophilia bacterium]|nr:hypothetical protein [Thermoleophilia bacterium]
MHEPRDDGLEQALESLSRYTGEPGAVWQSAIELHRREREQRLWRWVRRPAPALAAACLAALVASVALRPAQPAREP